MRHEHKPELSPETRSLLVKMVMVVMVVVGIVVVIVVAIRDRYLPICGHQLEMGESDNFQFKLCLIRLFVSLDKRCYHW